MKIRYDPKIEIICIVCGITCIKRKSYSKVGKQQYCSSKCLLDKQKKEGECEQICERCGKVEMKCNWDLQRFCSRECYEANRQVDTLKKRFLKKTKKTTTCWLWTAGKNLKGYGKIGYGIGSARTSLLTHRASWLIYKGEIPKGQSVLHVCDNPPCVNPDHLFLGTNLDNRQDMLNKKRQRRKLTDEEVKDIKLLLRQGTLYIYQIAKKFGVSTYTIDRIRNNKTKVYRGIYID